MSKYPLDDNVLQEEYEALLIKLALKEYAAEQSEKLMRESNEQFIDPELYTWEHCYAPTWLPNGYEVKTYSADVWGVSVVYQNGSYNLSFDQFLSDTNLTLQTDSENALETKTIFINDSEALINTKEYSTATYTTIIWQSGNMLFRVITNDAKEVAIQFAQSIKVLR